MNHPWLNKTRPLHEWILEEEAKPGPAWILKDWVLAGGFTIISGRPKRGFKTFIAMAQAQALSSGKEFMGFKPLDGPKNVWFIEAEGAPKTTANRFRSFANGSAQSGTTLWSNIKWLHHPESLLLKNNGTIDAMVQFIKENKIDVVYLDTLGLLSGADENSNTEANQVLRNIKRITGLGVAVVALHHLTKGSTDWKQDCDDLLRGAGSWGGGYDVHLHVRHPPNSRNGEFVWERRTKDGNEKFFKGMWWLESDKTKEDEPLKKIVVDFEQVDSLEAASERDKDFYLGKLLPDQKYGMHELRDKWELPLAKVRELVAEFEKEGIFTQVGRKYYYE